MFPPDTSVHPQFANSFQDSTSAQNHVCWKVQTPSDSSIADFSTAEGYREDELEEERYRNRFHQFAASFRKEKSTTDNNSTHPESMRTSVRDKSVASTITPRIDRKHLVSALGAEVGVSELALVIPEFRRRTRPLPEENINSISPERLDENLNCSARI